MIMIALGTLSISSSSSKKLKEEKRLQNAAKSFYCNQLNDLLGVIINLKVVWVDQSRLYWSEDN